MQQITIKTNRRCQLLDVTEQVAHVMKQSVKEIKGLLVSVPHTTAGVLLNECADPSVAEDILEHLEKIVPHRNNYRHSEGNSDAHIKSTIVGTSILVPVANNKMVLGTWQGIFFAEFDGPRTRKLTISFLS